MSTTMFRYTCAVPGCTWETSTDMPTDPTQIGPTVQATVEAYCGHFAGHFMDTTDTAQRVTLGRLHDSTGRPGVDLAPGWVMALTLHQSGEFTLVGHPDLHKASAGEAVYALAHILMGRPLVPLPLTTEERNTVVRFEEAAHALDTADHDKKGPLA